MEITYKRIPPKTSIQQPNKNPDQYDCVKLVPCNPLYQIY